VSDIRAELDAYRAESRAARAEAAAFRAEIAAYRAEVSAWRVSTEVRFDRLDSELQRLAEVVFDILGRLNGNEGQGDT
jgi:multidrug resistance efflux pump